MKNHEGNQNVWEQVNQVSHTIHGNIYLTLIPTWHMLKQYNLYIRIRLYELTLLNKLTGTT